MFIRQFVRGGLMALALAGFSAAASADVVFTDNFNRGTSPVVGNGWVTTQIGSPFGFVSANRLVLTSPSSSAAGNVYTTQATSNFADPWENVLTANPGLVTWTFNMQSSDFLPTGFNSGGTGLAFVLAADNANLNAASGYAVVLGEPDVIDSLGWRASPAASMPTPTSPT